MAYQNEQLKKWYQDFNQGLTKGNAKQKLTNFNNKLGMRGVTNDQLTGVFGDTSGWKNQMKNQYGYDWKNTGNTDFTKGYSQGAKTKEGLNKFGDWLNQRAKFQDNGTGIANRAIYDKAKTRGFSNEMVDQAMGYSPGTSEQYVQQQGWDELQGQNLTGQYQPQPGVGDIGRMNQFYTDKAGWNQGQTDDYAKDYYDYFDKGGITAAEANQALGKQPGFAQNYIQDKMGLLQLSGVPQGQQDFQHGYNQDKMTKLAAELRASGMDDNEVQNSLYSLAKGAGITATEMDSMTNAPYGTSQNQITDMNRGLLTGRANENWNEPQWRNKMFNKMFNNQDTSFSGGPSGYNPVQGGTSPGYPPNTPVDNAPPPIQPSTPPGQQPPFGQETYTPYGDVGNLPQGLQDNLPIMYDAALEGTRLQNQDLQAINSELKSIATTDNAQLFSKRLADVIDKGSPLMKRAAFYADQEMAKRGLTLSSLGIEAAQAAILDQASKIAAGDVGVDQFNIGEQNATQRALLGEYGATGRAGLSNNAQLYQDSLRAGYDMQKQSFNNLQSSALTNEENRIKSGLASEQYSNQSKNDMERDMLKYTNSRAIEMLKQQTGLYGKYLDGWSDIVTSTIPESQKTDRLRGLAREIDGSVNALNRYSKLDIKNAPGDFSFKPVNNVKRADEAQPQADNTPLIEQDYKQLNNTVNDIYSKVRVGGGDTPEESLIDGWRNAMADIKDNDYEFNKVMRIYREKGVNNDNWKEVLSEMTTSVRQYLNSDTSKDGIFDQLNNN